MTRLINFSQLLRRSGSCLVPDSFRLPRPSFYWVSASQKWHQHISSSSICQISTLSSFSQSIYIVKDISRSMAVVFSFHLNAARPHFIWFAYLLYEIQFLSWEGFQLLSSLLHCLALSLAIEPFTVLSIHIHRVQARGRFARRLLKQRFGELEIFRSLFK